MTPKGADIVIQVPNRKDKDCNQPVGSDPAFTIKKHDQVSRAQKIMNEELNQLRLQLHR